MTFRIFPGPVLGWVVACVLLTGAVQAQTWEGVEKTLGRPGIPEREGVRFEFPRTDLNVLVHGVPLEPRSLLVSSASFTSRGQKAALQAWVLVLESEVPKVTTQAARNGLQLSTLDPPFPGASPGILRLSLSGQGPRSKLAWALKMVLGSTGTPMTVLSPTPQPTSKKDPWVNARNAFGMGSEMGRSLVYEWDTGEGKALRVVLQKEGNDLMVWGEVHAPSKDLAFWSPQMVKRGFQVMASSHDASPQGWVDFGCLNDEKKAINDLTSLLQECGFKVDGPI